eukprot:Nitzschia sp. Nitz4//scaffold63_size106090//31672//32406//NITZ4_004384-RA/size106090-processed-gene-0.121-mRNA-1//1//CDS//3329555957//5425//frame0
MNILLDVVAANDHAVNLALITGHEDEANRILQTSLTTIKRRLPSYQEASPESATPVRFVPTGESTQASSGSAFALRNDDGWSLSECFVYGRPILCRDVLAAYIFENESLSNVGTVVAATIIFNISVIQHKVGRSISTSDSIAKATRLYGMVVQLCDLCANRNGMQSTYPLELGVVAMNNLFQLLWDQGHHTEANGLATTLGTTVNRLLHSERQCQLRLLRECWQDVLTNTVSLHVSSSKGAAAA